MEENCKVSLPEHSSLVAKIFFSELWVQTRQVKKKSLNFVLVFPTKYCSYRSGEYIWTCVLLMHPSIGCMPHSLVPMGTVGSLVYKIREGVGL